MKVREFTTLLNELRGLEKLPETPERKARMKEINEKIDKEYYGEEYNE